MTKRFGLFGGTFDPPHKGHVALARAACRELKLDRLYVVPAGHPPHKTAPPESSALHRLAMAKIAFRGVPRVEDPRVENPRVENPRVVVSSWEIRQKGVSYTYKTLQAFQGRHPQAEWFLIVGGDSWQQFKTWRYWKMLLRKVSLVVGLRRGTSENGPVAATILKTKLPKVSSTQWRKGRAVRGLISLGVRAYIKRKKLYGGYR
jgi:nicotinate-nucleotide adenylyltransferase